MQIRQLRKCPIQPGIWNFYDKLITTKFIKLFPILEYPSGVIRFQVATNNFAAYTQKKSKLSNFVSFQVKGALYDGNIFQNFTDFEKL